jgi:hypothetical protein
VLPQEVQEALIVASLHVEQAGDDLVVPARLFEAAPYDFTNVGARDLPIHEQRIDSRPEGLVLLNHPLIKVVGNRASPFTLRAKEHGVIRPDLGRQVLDPDRGTTHRNDKPFDDVLEFADVSWPLVLGQCLHRFRGYAGNR